eukprot:1434886-Pleurochrysis_carterae.AAC.1
MPQSALSALCGIADGRVGGPAAEPPRPPRKAHHPSRALRSVLSTVQLLRGWWVGGQRTLWHRDTVVWVDPLLNPLDRHARRTS